jgi:hypothetical protein
MVAVTGRVRLPALLSAGKSFLSNTLSRNFGRVPSRPTSYGVIIRTPGVRGLAYEPQTPFENIESAQQFVELLCEAIEEARREVEVEVTRPQPERRLEALQLVSYNLAKLSLHLSTSHRILNDLRTLRRLLFQERGVPEEEEEAAEAAESAGAE